MTTCRKCGEEKAASGFYRSDPNTCKECVKAAVHAYRKANLDRIREYDRNRPNRDQRRELNRERSRDLRNDPERWREQLKRSAEARLKFKERRHARVVVGNAIRKGTLKVQPCEVCGFGLCVNAHHEDYSKPLDVRWLCLKHHGERHREINEERRAQERAA